MLQGNLCCFYDTSDSVYLMGDSLMFSSLIYDNRVWYGPSCSMAFFVPVFATGSY